MQGVNRRNGLARRAITAVAILAVAAIVAHGIFGPNGLPAYLRKRREYNNLRQQIQRLKQQDQSLQEEVQGLRSDPATIEEHAREELRMSRPNEKIYVVPQENSDTSAAGLAKQPHAPPSSNP